MRLTDILISSQSVILAILGRRGMGKTTLLRSVMSLAHQQHRVLWAVDPEYQLRPRRKTGGIHVVNSPAALPTLSSIGRGGIILFDEVDRWGHDPRVVDVMNYCRPWGVSVAWTARRPARVPRDLTALADYFILYRVTEPRDLAYIREYSEDAARIAPSIQPFQPVILPL